MQCLHDDKGEHKINCAKALQQPYGLHQHRTKTRGTDKCWKWMVKPFIKDLEKRFDIRARDVNTIRKQEALHGVKETEEERTFYLDQSCRERKLLCD